MTPMIRKPNFLSIETEDFLLYERVNKMRSRSIQFILRLSFALALCAALFVFTAPLSRGQGVPSDSNSAQVTTAATQEAGEATAKNETVDAPKEAKPALLPVFKEYRGVDIGMTADDVRSKLNDYLKSKSDGEDLYLFAGGETAIVYYDAEGKVTAISVDFPAKSAKAPVPKDVLGEEIQAKDDGSMYSLVRYPKAGYWVAYSRTAGDSPLVTVTIQKMR
jgi:hypothetical protein